MYNTVTHVLQLIISGDNPVIDLDVGELEDEVARIISMGDPVQAFLTSDEFTSVDPDNQEVQCIAIQYMQF